MWKGGKPHAWKQNRGGNKTKAIPEKGSRYGGNRISAKKISLENRKCGFVDSDRCMHFHPATYFWRGILIQAAVRFSPPSDASCCVFDERTKKVAIHQKKPAL